MQWEEVKMIRIRKIQRVGDEWSRSQEIKRGRERERHVDVMIMK